MTSRRRTVVRRALALLAAALVAGAPAAWALTRPGVFESELDLVFVVPRSEPGNALNGTSAALIDLAGAVGKAVARPIDGPYTVEEVPLAVQGITDGTSVRQPNAGGQWNFYATQPTLQLRATGSSALVVRQRIDRLAAEVAGTLARLQDEAGAPASSRVRIVANPTGSTISRVDGSRPRAAAALALLAAAAMAVVAASGGRVRRPARHRQVGT